MHNKYRDTILFNKNIIIAAIVTAVIVDDCNLCCDPLPQWLFF